MGGSRPRLIRYESAVQINQTAKRRQGRLGVPMVIRHTNPHPADSFSDARLHVNEPRRFRHRKALIPALRLAGLYHRAGQQRRGGDVTGCAIIGERNFGSAFGSFARTGDGSWGAIAARLLRQIFALSAAMASSVRPVKADRSAASRRDSSFRFGTSCW
jgi:hypothetical protein